MIAALFVREDSFYKTLPSVDAWDMARDARAWPGGCSVVAHPPCRAWGVLRHFAKPRPDEKALALFAVDQIRQWGGILEHPAYSTLWGASGLPRPGRGHDHWDGWTFPAPQKWWGHKAEKATWFYIVGCDAANLPPIPYTLARATHVISPSKRPSKPSITRAEREETPPALALWLVEVARRCDANRRAACSGPTTAIRWR